MKIVGIIVVLALIVASIFFAGSDINVSNGQMPDADVNVSGDSGNLPEYEVIQTEEGRMPDVDVDVDTKAGRLPDVDIDTPDVDVETETRTIEVPTGVDVDAAEDSVIDDVEDTEVIIKDTDK